MKKSLSLIAAYLFTFAIISSQISINSQSLIKTFYTEKVLNTTVIILPPVIVPNKKTKTKPINGNNETNVQQYALDDTPIIIPRPHAPKQIKKIVVPTKRRAFETEYVQA